jgi:hypothetical protein
MFRFAQISLMKMSDIDEKLLNRGVSLIALIAAFGDEGVSGFRKRQ